MKYSINFPLILDLLTDHVLTYLNSKFHIKLSKALPCDILCNTQRCQYFHYDKVWQGMEKKIQFTSVPGKSGQERG